MIRVYDYKCESGHVYERFQSDDDLVDICPQCGKLSMRQLCAPVARLEGITGAFPGAYHAWERKRAEKQAEERKKAASHGE
jgi:hypothetical protein